MYEKEINSNGGIQTEEFRSREKSPRILYKTTKASKIRKL